MSRTHRICALAAAAALALTMSACSADEPQPVVSEPAPKESTEAASEATEEEAAEATEEPAETPGDNLGVVDRTGTWTEYDADAIEFPAWDEAELEELGAYAAADAALDFIYLASAHDTAFHTMPEYEARQYANDGSESTQQLVSQWWLEGEVDDLFGRASTPHVSPLSLIDSITSGDPYDGTSGFTASDHNLTIEHISGMAFTEAENEMFASFAAHKPLSGPVVMVDTTVSGQISGADAEGTPRSIDVPFSTISVVMTLDNESGAWKVLDFVTYSTEHFVGDETGDEFGN